MLSLRRPTTSVQITDEQLLEQYRSSGQSRYLGQLYERYMPMVYGVCFKITRDAAAAEDAVMGIYEEVVRKLQTNEVESFRGWLYVLARNYCLMEWRRQQRKPTDLHAPEEMYRYDAVEQAFEVELPQHQAPLAQCMGELPDEQRRSVELFYYEDKSYKEIAELIREEIGKVRSFIQNGRRNLKICMEKLGFNQL
jgi:RNA polymerase sigma factor (sigma-70 family)